MHFVIVQKIKTSTYLTREKKKKIKVQLSRELFSEYEITMRDILRLLITVR